MNVPRFAIDANDLTDPNYARDALSTVAQALGGNYLKELEGMTRIVNQR